MQVRTITVSAQRKLPHPSVDFANFSTLVSLSAELGDDDNAVACAKKLQAQADNLAEQHAEAIADRLRTRNGASKAQSATANTAAGLAAKHGGKQ